MAERKHSQSGKAGGPFGAARGAFAPPGVTPFLWRPSAPANDNPTPIGKRISRALRLLTIAAILGSLVWSAVYFR